MALNRTVGRTMIDSLLRGGATLTVRADRVDMTLSNGREFRAASLRSLEDTLYYEASRSL